MNLLVWAIDMSPPSDDPAPPKELQELVHKSAFIAEVEELLRDIQEDQADFVKYREEIVRRQMEDEKESEPYKYVLRYFAYAASYESGV